MNAYQLTELAHKFRFVDDPRLEVCRSIKAGASLGGYELEVYEVKTDQGSVCLARYKPAPSYGGYGDAQTYRAVMPQSWVEKLDRRLSDCNGGVSRLSCALNELELQDDIILAAKKHGVYKTGGSRWFEAGERVLSKEVKQWETALKLDEDSDAGIAKAAEIFRAMVYQPEERRLNALANAARIKAIIEECRAISTSTEGATITAAARPRRPAL